MLDTILVTDRQACFQFKTSFSPCTIMQMVRYDLDELERQLNVTVSRAPTFFMGSPVVIDLEIIKGSGIVDFVRIKQILQANNMVPVGVRGGSQEQHTAAAGVGIPAISIGKIQSPIIAQTKKSDKWQPAKLITTPIRSGMQVYAKDTDLIVVAPVSAGAELLADGNIHVYGPLRGRALAGVQGDTNARIFCQVLEAELVAIAGYYLVKEDINNTWQKLPMHQTAVQIYLDNEQVRIEVT